MAKITITDIKNLKPLGRNLMKIKETGTAPINLVKYRKWGLIKTITLKKGVMRQGVIVGKRTK